MLMPNYMLAHEILEVMCQRTTPVNHICLWDGE